MTSFFDETKAAFLRFVSFWVVSGYNWFSKNRNEVTIGLNNKKIAIFLNLQIKKKGTIRDHLENWNEDIDIG